MKHFSFAKLAVGIMLVLASSSLFAKCPVSGKDLLGAPKTRETWCTMECINEMLDFVEHHSRGTYDSDALYTGIVTARACASQYYDVNGKSVPYWDEMVDKTNYMLHQAGVIGSHTKNSVYSDGSRHSGCELKKSTACSSRFLEYGREVFDAYFSCMSVEDQKRVFSQLPCLYYIEGQIGSISAETKDAERLMSFIHDGNSVYRNLTGPYQQKIIDRLLGDMQNTVARCHPELASWKPQPAEKEIELDEVVVVAKAPELKKIEQQIQNDLIAQSCKMSQGQPGVNDSIIGISSSDGQGNGTGVNGSGNGTGNGNGPACRYATNIVVCEVPPDF